MSESKNDFSGLHTCDVLFLIFFILKLTGQITWSWWWVTAPLWIPIGILLLFEVFCLIAAIFE